MLLKSFFAFLIGGAVCTVAQILIDKTKLTPAKILVSLVVFGVILGGVGLYHCPRPALDLISGKMVIGNIDLTPYQALVLKFVE